MVTCGVTPVETGRMRNLANLRYCEKNFRNFAKLLWAESLKN
jgi:hypothetical protein